MHTNMENEYEIVFTQDDLNIFECDHDINNGDVNMKYENRRLEKNLEKDLKKKQKKRKIILKI